jgi:hypothetical protein
LKRLCELEMLAAISVETVAHILYVADQYSAEVFAFQAVFLDVFVCLFVFSLKELVLAFLN